MKIYEEYIRSHLPKEIANESIDFFEGMYLNGLTVMHEGERGGEDIVVYQAKSEEDLKLWQLETVCTFIKTKDAYVKKWRYYRDHAEDGKWYYIEYTSYDYNAIEDTRIYGFEKTLRNLKYAFPEDLFEKRVKEYVSLMNRWFIKPHWDYDRENLCFIEISDSKEYVSDKDYTEEPREGSIIKKI